MSFNWTNLFGACLSSDHCGQFKDREGEFTPKPYSPDNLIKPDHHDPKLFFRFTLLGEIIFPEDLEDNFKFRAKETIRVFNLNTPSLMESRLSIIESFNLRLITILSLKAIINAENFTDELSRLEEDITKSEYRSAIESALFS